MPRLIDCHADCFFCFVFRLAQSVRLMMAIAIFLSYGLQFYVPMSIIWPPLRARIQDERMQRVLELLLRTVLVVVTCEFARCFTKQKLFIFL